jgi:hypothetical protein
MAVRFSDVRIGRPYFNPKKIPGIHLFKRVAWPQGHSAAGRIRPIKKFKDLIGNRNPDIPACSIVPQPTTPTINKYTRMCWESRYCGLQRKLLFRITDVSKEHIDSVSIIRVDVLNDLYRWYLYRLFKSMPFPVGVYYAAGGWFKLWRHPPDSSLTSVA